MYKNRLSLQSKKISPNTHPHLFIRRSEMPYEERIKNVDHVCALLTESRFGTDFYYEPVPGFRDIPDSAPIDFCDLHGFTTNAQRAQSNTFDFPHSRRASAVKHSQGRKGRNASMNERAYNSRDALVRTGSGSDWVLSGNISGTHGNCFLCASMVINSRARGSPNSQGRIVAEARAVSKGLTHNVEC